MSVLGFHEPASPVEEGLESDGSLIVLGTQISNEQASARARPESSSSSSSSSSFRYVLVLSLETTFTVSIERHMPQNPPFGLKRPSLTTFVSCALAFVRALAPNRCLCKQRIAGFAPATARRSETLLAASRGCTAWGSFTSLKPRNVLLRHRGHGGGGGGGGGGVQRRRRRRQRRQRERQRSSAG